MNRIAEISSRLASQIVARKQMLMTQRERSMLPPLYTQDDVEDPMVYVKFFNPYGVGTWLAIEFDGHDRFFGAVDLGHGWELGYFSLNELESIPAYIMGRPHRDIQGIERDAHFRPEPLSKAKHA